MLRGTHSPREAKLARCRLLVAVTEMGYVHARRALLESFDLVSAFSLAQAITSLKNSDIDAVLASIHFDDSRMFDLLRATRRIRPATPFICCVLLGTALSDAALRGLTSAATQEGCSGFINYNEMQRTIGFDAADRQFREEVLKLLPPACGGALDRKSVV